MNNIVVCIKQVPDTSDIKWTKENNISRDGMLSILNPADKTALGWAMKLKEATNARVTVFSMGPNQAKSVLEYSLALGADEAYLLCDKVFAASDTLATGNVLSSAIKKIVPNFDLIICGQMALDGDTAQTGATIANLLGIENVSYVVDIEYEDSKLKLKTNLEEGFEVVQAELPLLVCVEDDNSNVLPKISNYISAQNKKINILGINDIEIDKTTCGILGSPTFVSNVFRKKTDRKCEIMENYDAETLLDKINLMRKNV